jgi:hypothetical protein
VLQNYHVQVSPLCAGAVDAVVGSLAGPVGTVIPYECVIFAATVLGPVLHGLGSL